ncbi:hypothetical protein TNCV_3452441 [Trichonephila clavipes]|nr:hypothetical protein TNCV_3452441 [Trichonephila clavipes]
MATTGSGRDEQTNGREDKNIIRNGYRSPRVSAPHFVKRCSRDILEKNTHEWVVTKHEVVPHLQVVTEAIVQQDNAQLYYAKNGRDFFSAQHMLLALSSDVSHIEKE